VPITCIARSIVLCAVVLLSRLQAAEVRVSSIAALQAAIDTATAGDILVLNDGTYVDNVLSIGTGNITVKAETPGGVRLNGANAIVISGSHVTFSGFQFTSGSIPGIVITVSGDHASVTQLNFSGYTAQKYITVLGQYDDISYCSFENKPAAAPQGNLVHIAPNGSAPNYARIRYCSFRNMPGTGGDNGNECIRIANGAQSAFLCRTIVEFCLFENTGMGDSECISVKSRENVIRYNTFVNNQEAMLCFRNGDDCAAYGNFFIDAGGIRVKEANNIFCYNNYFENSGAAGSQGCVRYVYYTANTTNVLKNINFLHNTFVNCGVIDLDRGAANNTWANNIFTKASGNIFTAGSAAGISWAGNVYQGTLGLPIPSGLTNADPKLVKNPFGWYGLSESSPAIDASSALYPAVMDIAAIDDDPSLLRDVSGRSRPAAAVLKDAGWDEFAGAGSVTNRPLKAGDVGPSYRGGPATHVSRPAVRTADADARAVSAHAYPNPFNPATTIRFRVPAEGHVSLKVYDQLGREAAALVDGYQTPGLHQVRWNADRFAGGAHYRRLQTSGSQETLQLLLIR